MIVFINFAFVDLTQSNKYWFFQLPEWRTRIRFAFMCLYLEFVYVLWNVLLISRVFDDDYCTF